VRTFAVSVAGAVTRVRVGEPNALIGFVVFVGFILVLLLLLLLFEAYTFVYDVALVLDFTESARAEREEDMEEAERLGDVLGVRDGDFVSFDDDDPLPLCAPLRELRIFADTCICG